MQNVFMTTSNGRRCVCSNVKTQWKHTHHEHTPGAVGSHIVVAPGEKLGVRFLRKGLTSVIVLKVQESTGYSIFRFLGD